MRLPWSDDRSAYGQIVIPIAVINNGEGPTALLTGGVHGDEYEGQIVLGALARDLDPASIRGRIIICPAPTRPPRWPAVERRLSITAISRVSFPATPPADRRARSRRVSPDCCCRRPISSSIFTAAAARLIICPAPSAACRQIRRSRHACSISCWPLARPIDRGHAAARGARHARRRRRSTWASPRWQPNSAVAAA